MLNVTPDLPNTFEEQGCGINYLKIPIADHWSQNLAVHFPQAIRFIGQYNKFLFLFKLQLLTMLLCQVYNMYSCIFPLERFIEQYRSISDRLTYS